MIIVAESAGLIQGPALFLSDGKCIFLILQDMTCMILLLTEDTSLAINSSGTYKKDQNAAADQPAISIDPVFGKRNPAFFARQNL